jgi:hypothetical protein
VSEVVSSRRCGEHFHRIVIGLKRKAQIPCYVWKRVHRQQRQAQGNLKKGDIERDGILCLGLVSADVRSTRSVPFRAQRKRVSLRCDWGPGQQSFDMASVQHLSCHKVRSGRRNFEGISDITEEKRDSEGCSKTTKLRLQGDAGRCMQACFSGLSS